MNQQVNLLAPIFRKQQTLLSGRLAVLLCVMVVLVLGVVHMTTVWRVAALASEQTTLEARRITVTQQLDTLAEQMRGGGKSQPLIEERDRLAADVSRKSNALAALSRSELGNTTGFSPQFIGLARQRIGGLWLTHITLGSHGLELRGVTLSEELLPRYLDMLGSEPVFSGLRFGHATLSRGVDPAGLSFELRSQEAASAPAGAVASGSGAGS